MVTKALPHLGSPCIPCLQVRGQCCGLAGPKWGTVRATSLGYEPQARGCKRDTLRRQDYAHPTPEATNRDCKYGRPFHPASDLGHSRPTSDLGHSPRLVAVTWIYESLSNLQVVASSVPSGTKPNPAAKIQPPNSVTMCAWPPKLVDKVSS